MSDCQSRRIAIQKGEPMSKTLPDQYRRAQSLLRVIDELEAREERLRKETEVVQSELWKAREDYRNLIAEMK